jgi:hypothetical protein
MWRNLAVDNRLLLVNTAFTHTHAHITITDLVNVWNIHTQLIQLANAFATTNPTFKLKQIRDLVDIMAQVFEEKRRDSVSSVQRYMEDGVLRCRFEMFGFKLCVELMLERDECGGELIRDQLIRPLLGLAKVGQLVEEDSKKKKREGGIDVDAITRVLEDSTKTTRTRSRSEEEEEEAPVVVEEEAPSSSVVVVVDEDYVEPVSILEKRRAIAEQMGSQRVVRKRARFI